LRIAVGGQVGYFMAQIKTLGDVHIGDTVTEALRPTTEALAGRYKEPKPMVYSGLYPVNNNDFEDLREALPSFDLTTPASHIHRNPARALASDFAVASSACFTARSFSNASNAIASWTWYKPRPTSPMRF